MNMERFWKKKIIVTYILSVMVFLIHISSFGQYRDTEFNSVNNFFSNLFSHTLTETAVPLFFIISGALFFRNYSDNKYIEKLRTRLHSLVVPYLLWNIISMVFAIVTSYTFMSNYFVGREKFVISLSNVLLGIFHHKCNNPFWFVFNLFFFVIISPIINMLLCSKRSVLISVSVITIFVQLNIGLPDIIFSFKSSIVYYMIGAIIGKFYMDKFVSISKKNDIIISGIICVCGVGLFLGTEYDLYELPIIIKIVVISVISLALWKLLDPLTEKVKNIDFMKNSFFVFALHINVSAVVTKLLYILLPKRGEFAIINFLLTVVITLCIINTISMVLKKYFKPIYSILSGART